MIVTNQSSSQLTNSTIPFQENIPNTYQSKNRKKIKFFLLLLIVVIFLFSLGMIYAAKSSLLIGNLIGKKIPNGYNDCLDSAGNKVDYEHNSYRCVWRISSDNLVLYAQCKAVNGKIWPGLVGCTVDHGCTKSPNMCEIVYYKDDFKIPQSFEECQLYSIIPIKKTPVSSTQSCIISIDLWSYNQNQAKSLYNTCYELGRKSFTDDIQSDAFRGNCTLHYRKQSQSFPEIYKLATYSATSSAFIKKVLLSIHNKQLSKFKPDVLSPTPTFAISLSEAIKSCQESGGEWNKNSCNCNKTINKNKGCFIDENYFPYVDRKNLSNQPKPSVIGLNGLEELVFKDDLSTCNYLGNINNQCSICRQDSDCGNDYEDDWYSWIRYSYGPTCNNGYCKY